MQYLLGAQQRLSHTQISIKNMHFSTSIHEMKPDIYNYEVAKYTYMICNQMLLKRTTEEHEYSTYQAITIFAQDNSTKI